MTEQLKQLLHEQAMEGHFDPVDLDALVADGDRRVRRRRWAGVAAGAVAAVAVAATAPLLLGGSNTVADPATPGTAYPLVTGDLPRDMFAGGRVTWSSGSVFHYGDVTVDVGMPIDAFVGTSIGFVYASDGGVWQVDGDAQTRIGSLDPAHVRLVGDEETPKAAWLDPAGRLMVYDEGTGRVTPYDAERASDLYALDAGTVYWATGGRVVATDLGTGATEEVVELGSTDGADSNTVLAAEDDLLATRVNAGTAFGPVGDLRMRLWDGAYGSIGSFSDDARYYTADADEVMLYDVARGERVPLDLSDYWFSTGYGWAGDRTLAVLAMRTETSPMEILTCEVPAGSCSAYTTLGSQDDVVAHVQLPVGSPIED